MNIRSNSFEFLNTNREENYKILQNIDPNKVHGIDEIIDEKVFKKWSGTIDRTTV